MPETIVIDHELARQLVEDFNRIESAVATMADAVDALSPYASGADLAAGTASAPPPAPVAAAPRVWDVSDEALNEYGADDLRALRADHRAYRHDPDPCRVCATLARRLGALDLRRGGETMTIQQLIAAWPQVQAAFAAQGLTVTLGQAIGLADALEPIFAGKGTPPAPPAPQLPLTLAFGADANNAPYGVTLAGFDPQNHQGCDLRDPKNAKYIAYAYLVANKIQPTKTWATAAAAFLASLVPLVPWVAADTETLVYGDEYIHTAPNGHGMPIGTFNPDAAPVEFFWSAWGA